MDVRLGLDFLGLTCLVSGNSLNSSLFCGLWCTAIIFMQFSEIYIGWDVLRADLRDSSFSSLFTDCFYSLSSPCHCPSSLLLLSFGPFNFPLYLLFLSLGPFNLSLFPLPFSRSLYFSFFLFLPFYPSNLSPHLFLLLPLYLSNISPNLLLPLYPLRNVTTQFS